MIVAMLHFSAIYWDPRPEIFVLPLVEWPVLWYGALFAVGFAVGFLLFVNLLMRYLHLGKKQAVLITDRLTAYMVVGTVVGARLGHLFFYEQPASYLTQPWTIFEVWKGGLASHGAAVGIVAALLLFRKTVRAIEPRLTFVCLLDLVAIPTAFAGFCIRVGNFINQEILGVPTTLPWGVVFGHPQDYSLPTARHPVQLYEALFYLSIFLLLWRLSYIKNFLSKTGTSIGLFLTLVFSFRFFVEFLKTEQSSLISFSYLTMGQLLSLPAIGIGIVILFLTLFRNQRIMRL